MKSIIFYSLLMLLPVFAQAQSVYKMEYIYHADGYDLPLTALFFQRQDDSGFMRVRYIDAKTGENFIYEMALEDEYQKDNNGRFVTDRLNVNTVNPITFGDTEMEITKQMMPSFIFVLNPASGFLEPQSILQTNKKGEKYIDTRAQFKARFLSGSEITRELFSQYFYPDEAFFIRYFSPESKDITAKEAK